MDEHLAESLDRLRNNLREVHGRIAAAAERAGRSAESIQLVAVTKYVPTAWARRLVDLGCHDLGENRPQQLWQRAQVIPTARWHMMGPLQTNKVAKTVTHAAVIHSCDRPNLIDALRREASNQRKAVDVYLEVNISGDASKHGFHPAELPEYLRTQPSGGLAPLRVLGLMGMSGLESDAATARNEFRRLRELRDKLQVMYAREHGPWRLSMGMSDDFELAVEEGADCVRIGSAIWHGIDTSVP